MAYKIEIKTPDGVYDYEEEDLTNLDLLLKEHPDYDSLQAKEVKENGKKEE